jgi:uncharacterized protein (DUF433 family)
MFDRITSNPAILGGKPIIRGTRISIEFILDLPASGATGDQVISKYPQLTISDVQQSLQYAAASVRNEVLLHVEKMYQDAM